MEISRPRAVFSRQALPGMMLNPFLKATFQNNEADQSAWNNLQLLCKQKKISANQGVILALLACKEGTLPICIAREQEQRIVQQVTETIVNALQKSCSAFINASASEKHVLGITQEHSALESSTEPDMDSSATDYSGIDWDFAGG